MKDSQLKNIFLGEITLKNKVVISDPCYSLGTWCQGVYNNVRPGKYKCFVSYFYDTSWAPECRRVESVHIIHEDYKSLGRLKRNTDCTIGIDSGQMAIFDFDYYCKFHPTKKIDESWYEKCCDLTYVESPNPDYVPFEKSQYYAEYLKLQDEWRTTKDASIYDKLWDIREDYNRSLEGKTYIGRTTASTVDGLSLVSATAWGDMDPTVYFKYNSKNEIVGIKLLSK